MKNALKYFRCKWNDVDVNGKDKGFFIYFFEVDQFNKGDVRRIVYYPDSTIRAANIFGGYMGEQVTPGKMYNENLVEEFKDTQGVEAMEISKDDFEREWEKATSQPGFYLKPYSEYTEEDYKMRNL